MIHNEDIKNRILSLLALLTLFSLPIGTGPTSVFSIMFLSFWLISGAWLKGWSWWYGQLPRLLPVIMLMLLPVIGLMWSIVPDPNYYSLLHKSHFWLIAGATACLTFQGIKLRNLILAFIVGVEVYVVMVLMVGSHLIEPFGIYYSLVRGAYITYSVLLVWATVLLSFIYKNVEITRTKWIVIIIILCNVLVISLLRGRSGYLVYLFFTPIIVANITGCRRWWVILLTCIILVGCLSFSPQIQSRISIAVIEGKRYLQGKETNVNDSSIGIRFLFWEGGYKIFKDHPFIGVGTGGYPVAMKNLYPNIENAFGNPHNFYIYVAANYGILGLVIYGWFWFGTLWRAWPYRNQLSGFTILSGLIVIGIASLTDTTPLSPATGILLAMLAGLPMSANIEESEVQN